jgi:hypothetical protein
MKMQIDGNILRVALKQWDLRKDAAAKAFNGSLHKFAGEEKDSPTQIVEELIRAELAIVDLQVAQMRYNLAVNVTVFGKEMTLAEAIKRVGFSGRVEKMWRGVTETKTSRYGLDDGLTRDPTRIRAEPVLKSKEALTLAMKASKAAGNLQAAIATGNATKVEVDLSPALLE